jgi:hypothetical protein
MKQYNEEEYIKAFGEQMWQDKVIKTLDEHEKKLGVEKVYATSLGSIFMVMINEETI